MNELVSQEKAIAVFEGEILEVKKFMSVSHIATVKAMRILLKHKQNDSYTNHYDTLDDYIDSEYAAYGKRSKVYYMMDIVEKFGDAIERQMSETDIPIPVTKLKKATKLITNQKDADRWLKNAINMTAIDFDNHVRQAQGLLSKDDTEHKHEWIEICRLCNIRRR